MNKKIKLGLIVLAIGIAIITIYFIFNNPQKNIISSGTREQECFVWKKDYSFDKKIQNENDALLAFKNYFSIKYPKHDFSDKLIVSNIYYHERKKIFIFNSGASVKDIGGQWYINKLGDIFFYPICPD